MSSAVGSRSGQGRVPDTVADERRATRRVRRRNLALAGLGAASVVGLVALAGAPVAGVAYDPGSPGPLGLRGVVEVLGSFDVQVDVSTSLPDDPSIRLLVPTDAALLGRHDEVLAFVRDGGTVVVAGPTSLHELEPGATGLGDAFASSARAPGCDLPAVADVTRVLAPRWPTFRGEDGTTVCFGRPGGEVDDAGDAVLGGWLAVVPEGDGALVALASLEPLLNRHLASESNAVLAAGLLGPAPGDRVVILPPPPPGQLGEGEASLFELLPDGVRRALLLLGIAALVAAVWRSRRLGRPVPERLPPVLPSAELARSVAGLLQRAGRREQAASTLRVDLRRTVARSMGSAGGATPPSELLVPVVVSRLGVGDGTARRALVDLPVPDDAELARVATAVAEVRAALRRPPPGEAPTGTRAGGGRAAPDVTTMER